MANDVQESQEEEEQLWTTPHQTLAGDANAKCSPCGLQYITPLAVQHKVPSHQEEQILAVRVMCKAVPLRVCTALEAFVMHAGC